MHVSNEFGCTTWGHAHGRLSVAALLSVNHFSFAACAESVLRWRPELSARQLHACSTSRPLLSNPSQGPSMLQSRGHQQGGTTVGCVTASRRALNRAWLRPSSPFMGLGQDLQLLAQAMATGEAAAGATEEAVLRRLRPPPLQSQPLRPAVNSSQPSTACPRCSSSSYQLSAAASVWA